MVVNGTYTVTNPEKLYPIIVEFEKENDIRIRSSFPVGTKFNNFESVDIFVGMGNILLATEEIKM